MKIVQKTASLRILLWVFASCVCMSAALLFLSACNETTQDSKTRYEVEYPSVSKVGYYAEYLGESERQKPEVKNEGVAESYPVYGTRLYGAGENTNAEEKKALLKENEMLIGTGLSNVNGTYDSMDAKGNLFLNGESLGRRLYKHTAAAGMYYGDVSDDESAVSKKITYVTRTYGNHITGLYAPAGEIIKIKMTAADFKSSGGVKVIIGQALSNDKANNIWAAREFNRMPVAVNAMNITEDTYTLERDEAGNITAYVGSFLGGPIYIKPMKAGSAFSIVIDGGVRYSHFILGYTTKAEFEENKTSSAPYFDLEIWDRGARHSGPKTRAKDFTYEELYRAAVLWENIARVSAQAPSSSPSGCGIDFLYDCFVAAGAAVAFPAQSTSVNCPDGWMTDALDYEKFVTSGNWGNIHEFNHHFQTGWGLTNDGEVSNNALSLVSYSLYTKISSARREGTSNEGLDGWNRYTSASWSLRQLIEGRENNLSVHSNILHGFGQDIFLKATQYKLGGNNDGWFRSLVQATGWDMTYYFTKLCGLSVSEEVLQWAAELELPMYVPVASVYQTGGERVIGGEKISYFTMQPYEIPANEPFEIDFDRCLVLPENFKFKVGSVTVPENGTLTKLSDTKYTYMPSAEERDSGKIKVTIELIDKDGVVTAEDAVLFFEFRQQAYKPNILDKITYEYDENSLPDSIETAVKTNFTGYSSKKTEDNVYESGQNGNAQVWFPESYTITQLGGKLYITSDGKYRISFRGRQIASLYLSLDDGRTYSPAVKIGEDDPDIGSHNLAVENGKYVDLQLKKGQWVYFRAFVMNKTNDKSYFDLGIGKFSGNSVKQSIVTNAYRLSYEPEPIFLTESRYRKTYAETYSEEYAAGTLMETNYKPWDDSYSVANLFDEDETNFIHSDKTDITEENPFIITADLGQTAAVNTFTIYGEPSKKYNPKNFSLYGGLSPDNLSLIAEVRDAEVSDNKTVIRFREKSVRYYKLIVTDTYANTPKYIAFRKMNFSLVYDGFTRLSPDDGRIVYKGNWKKTVAFSSFGHVLEGRNNATAEFGFYGSQFAIYSEFSDVFGAFDIVLDGEYLATVNSRETEGPAFLSELLEEKWHKVVLCGKEDVPFCVESVALKTSAPQGSPEDVPEPSDGMNKAQVVTLAAIIGGIGFAIVVFALAALYKNRKKQ